MSHSAEVAIADGRYLLDEIIHQAGDSQLWRGTASDGDTVLIKLIPRKRNDHENERLARMVRKEAACGQQLAHPHIRKFRESSQEADGTKLGHRRGFWYLVFEWVEFGTLRNLMNHGPLAHDDIKAVMEAVTDALAHAHSRSPSITHRDIKPENILLPDGKPSLAKLADFGTAHIDGAATHPTSSPRGTFIYMAPEQTRQGSPIDHRADQFSLALVLWELLAGARPFDAGDAAMNISRRRDHQLVPSLAGPSGKPSHSLEKALSRALAMDPSSRFTDIRAFASAILEAGASDGYWHTSLITALGGGSSGAHDTWTLQAILSEVGFEGIIDNRPQGGALWLPGDRALVPFMKKIRELLGVDFHFKKGGGKATGYRDAWWTTSPDPPLPAE